MVVYRRFHELTRTGSFPRARQELDRFWSTVERPPSRWAGFPVDEAREALEQTVSPPEPAGRAESAFLYPHALWTTWTLMSCLDVVSKKSPPDGALSAMRYARDSLGQYIECTSATLQRLEENDPLLASRKAREDEHFTREVARQLADIDDVGRAELDVKKLRRRAARAAQTFMTFPLKYVLTR